MAVLTMESIDGAPAEHPGSFVDIEAADRHRIWRTVANNYRALKEQSPDGYEPVVEVFVVGRPDPIQLAEVSTSRDAFSWTLFVAGKDGDTQIPSTPERLVFVPEQCVERIEIHFERATGQEFGFSHGGLDDAPMTDE